MTAKLKKKAKVKAKAKPKKRKALPTKKAAKVKKYRMKGGKLFNLWLTKDAHKMLHQKAEKFAGGNCSDLVRKAIKRLK